jgi:predicted ATPase
VTLVYQDGRVTCVGHTMLWFWGRSTVQELTKTQPQKNSLFSRIGDVFWFDQNRNVLSLQKLREEMITLWAAHTSIRSGAPDYLGQVEQRFAELFPGTKFVGIELSTISGIVSGADAYFLVERGDCRYDIAEMSSGEQAVFPLLYEFVRMGIARSVVLIDELELHLHPPQQQALMAALRRIGPDCQFIVTSHSPYLEQVTPDEDEFRLPGGQRCL